MTKKESGALCCNEQQKLKQNKGVTISGSLSSLPHTLSLFSNREEGKMLVSGGQWANLSLQSKPLFLPPLFWVVSQDLGAN